MVDPSYISVTPDKNGDIKQELTLSTQKADLIVTDVRFVENSKGGNPGTNWKEDLPMVFTSKLTKTDKKTDDGYVTYKLDISLNLAENEPIYGQFTIVTNHPKKRELTIPGTILARAK